MELGVMGAGEPQLTLERGDVEGAGQVCRVLAAFDGSARSEAGLEMAAALGEMIDAEVEVAEVTTPYHPGSLASLTSLARRHAVDTIHTPVTEVAVDGILSLLGEGGEVLACIATHGRGRSAALVGSVAQSLLARMDTPVLLAGPEAWILPGQGAVVVAAVDGSGADPTVVGTAVGWARRLGLVLRLVTVVEPTPGRADGAAPHRGHGPSRPVARLQALATAAEDAGVETTTCILEDPVSVAPALAEELQRATSALVVVGSRHRGVLHRVVLGDHAAQIVHRAPCLALAVPLGLRH